MPLFKRTNPRRSQVRRNISADRSLKVSMLADADAVISALLWLLFLIGCVGILSFELVLRGRYRALAALSAVVLFISVGAGFYIHHYQRRVLRNHARALALVGLFLLSLAAAKLGILSSGVRLWGPSWGTGMAIACLWSWRWGRGRRAAFNCRASGCF